MAEQPVSTAAAPGDSLPGSGSRPGRLRQFLVGALVVVTCLTVLSAVVGTFINRNLLKTNVWVSRVGPLADDPVVQDALTRELTREVMELVNPATLFSQALPDRGQILAVPLAGAVERFVSDQVHTFLASDTFAQLWRGLNERAHSLAVSALRGEGPLFQARDRAVVINLVPVVNGLLKELQSLSPELFGHKIELPELSVGMLPDDARQRLGAALGITIPQNFGAITIYEHKQLTAAQDAVELFDRFYALAVGLSVVLVALTLWLSRRRRRTALQMIFGVSLGLVVVRRVAFWVEQDVLDKIREQNQPVARAVLRAFLDPLVNNSALILAGLAVLAAVLVLTGPYAWAVNTRQRISAVVGDLRPAAGEAGTVEPGTAWIKGHRELLQIVGGALFLLGIWLFDLSWVGLFVGVALLVAYELAVWRAAGPGAGPAVPTPAR